MNLREQFEKWYRTQNKVFQDTFNKAEKGERDRYYYDRVESGWQGFQSGHAAGLEQQAKRITELEASLADSNEALQVMGLKLEQAEADIARLRVDAGRLDWLEDNSYALPYKDHGAGPELDLSRPAIDALMKDQSHSANTVGGPTPVMDAAPACERKE